MKKWIAAMLILLMLPQVLPLNALAAAGHVLTADELAAAYALTGFGNSGAQSNSAYHKGMKPNTTWNAMQVSDWLDEMLDTYLFSVEDILSRASIKLVKLREEDSQGYSRFADDSPEFQGVATYVQEMYRSAEALREEMRYQQDRIEEASGIIAELGRQLSESGSSLYSSDQVRLSAKIEAATAELKAARQVVADNAEEWKGHIEMMQTTLDAQYGGAADEEHAAGQAGDWIEALFAYGGEVAVNTVPVAVVNASGSRLGRMSTNSSVLSNADSATVHVMTENEVGFTFYTSDGNGGKKYLQGLKVTVKDTRNTSDESGSTTYTSDARGGVYIPSSKFTVDDDKMVHFRLDVEAEAQGVRSIGSAEVEMKLGEVRQMPMKPLSGSVSNAAAVSNASGGPYVYSASFEGHDIFKDDYEMMYSNINSWDFEIKVEVRNPGGGSAPTPLLGYWAEGDSREYELKWAKPTSHDGNVYTFKNRWKKTLAPDRDEEYYPFIAFSKDASAERFKTHLISVRSVVDSPVEGGSDAFSDIIDKGFGFSFSIPITDEHSIDVSFDLPWKKYLPKITIDNAGFVTASIGSALFEDGLSDNASWQSKDMKEYQTGQKNAEKEGGFAERLSQMGAAYDYYKTKNWKFLGEAKIDFGVFALLSGRKQAENEDTEKEQTLLKGRLAAGVLLKFAYSWTITYPVGPIPVYICFTVGVNVGFALSLEVGFAYSPDGGLKDWEFRPFNDITIDITLSFSAQAGAGVKGFAELYIRFTASINFRITLMLMGDGLSSFVVTGSIGLTIGATLVFLSLSKSFGPWSGTWYDSTAASNAVPPLQKYVAANANAAKHTKASSQEPTSYSGLAPAAKELLTNEADAHSVIRVGTSNGHTFAFYLDKVDGRQRVCWVDVNTGVKGNAQEYLSDYTRTPHSAEWEDYAFDVWSDGKTIMLFACCADQFDDNRYPAASTLGNPHAYAFILPLAYSDDIDALAAPSNPDYAPREVSAVSLDSALNPRGITNPHIEWAKVTYDQDIYVTGVEVYGFAERVDDGSGKKGYACFEYNGRNFYLLSDAAIKNALGDDHERVNLRSSVRGHSGTGPITGGFRCFGFVALSQPKEGVTGESAIELYDWEMNSAPVEADKKIPPTLIGTKRQAVVVKKGDIGAFELVQTVGASSDTYSQTVFYTEAETDGDGVKRYKLKGLHIGNKQDAGTRSLTYDVTDYSFDVVVPTPDFKVQTVNSTPYIYWLSTVQKENDSDPDTWRLWVSVYDPSSNTASTPTVYSEFTLQSGIVPRDVLLTADGYGYLTATAIPKDGQKTPEPMTLYRFPMTLKPILAMKDMVVEDTTVAAGDFEDTTIILMNEGNMGISTFDIEMFTKENGDVNVVETLHCDCMHPENSSLTMQGGGQRVILPEGRHAIYRKDDHEYSPRQRDWVLGEKKLTLKASQSDKNSAWVSSVSQRDSSTQFVQTNMLMPGAQAAFTGSLKIPESWSGDKTLYLRVSTVTSNANWQGAMANAAGAKGNTGIAPNAAATTDLTWTLNEAGDKLVLQAGELASNAAFSNAVDSGLIARNVEAPEPVALDVSIHDIEVDHRLYEDVDGTELMDIVIVDFADTDDRFKLTCGVYLDDAKEPYIVSLPLYDKAVANRATHTITLPVNTLVPDIEKHNRARVVISISAGSRDEIAYANNEFTLYLGGSDPLRFTKQPEDVTVQEGEDVSFTVEVAGGVKPYTYQWQIWDEKHQKWVDLPGFTGPTLSRENIEKKWDGCKFRCVVTDATGTQIISQEVTLTVRDKVPTGDSSNLPLYLTVALVALMLLVCMRRRAKKA